MFKLVRYFSVASFVAFAVVAVLLGGLYRRVVFSELTTMAESKNVALAQSFANSLWPQFTPFVAAASTLDGDALRAHPDVARLHRAVMAQMAGLSVVKVKVYNLNGLTVFSTDVAQIGEDKRANPGYRAARAGQVASELAHRDTFSAFEGIIVDRDLFSSYIPIRPDGPGGPVEGVFEIYDDVTPLVQQLERAQRTVVLGVAAILALLYAVLFLIIRRAEGILRRQQAEREQSAHELRKLSRAVEQSPSLVMITGLTGNIEYVNPRFTQVTGYTAAEVIGRNPRLLKSGEMSPAGYRTLWQTITAGGEWRGELHNKTKDGRFYWALASISSIKNSAGQITHFLSVQEDITRLKETEAKLAQARDRALEASRLKTRLLANVSHDLRTPLNAILGYTEMLQEGVYGPLSDSQRAAASEIIDSTGQLLNFVNNLLDQSRIESGRVTLNLVPFAPADLLADVQAMSGVLAAARGLELRSDIASGVPKTITGDPYWLRQIVVNLVSNAIKFTDEGSAHIHIFRSRPGQWGIQVSDTGCGIPPEAQTRIFDPFWQVNDTATRGRAGSGLGLSIVKQLTAMMGGEITVRSQVGGGSTFTLLLPLQTVEEAIV